MSGGNGRGLEGSSAMLGTAGLLPEDIVKKQAMTNPAPPPDLAAVVRAIYDKRCGGWYDKMTEQEREQLDWCFPDVHPGAMPSGDFILVQIRRPLKFKFVRKLDTKKFIKVHYAEESRDTDKWNTSVGKVLELGRLAYRDRRDIAKWWDEGPWCLPGFFVRIPRYGNDRWEIVPPGEDQDPAQFAIVKERDVLAPVTINPLYMRSHI